MQFVNQQYSAVISTALDWYDADAHVDRVGEQTGDFHAIISGDTDGNPLTGTFTWVGTYTITDGTSVDVSPFTMSGQITLDGLTVTSLTTTSSDTISEQLNASNYVIDYGDIFHVSGLPYLTVTVHHDDGSSFESTWGTTTGIAVDAAMLTDAGHFGDFDGDGKADVIWRDSDLTVATWQMGVAIDSHFLGGVGAWDLVGIGDFNGDHKADVLWESDDVLQPNDNGALLDWQMASSSTVESLNSLGKAPANSHLVGVGDVDGDGKSDLFWRDFTSGAVTIQTMAGGSTTIGGVGNDWGVVGAGDYNGDGVTDLMFRNASLGATAAWIMDGTSVSATVFYPGVSTDWHVVGTGDFDGNGVADLFWHNDNGANAVWLMDNTSHVEATGFFDGVDAHWHVAGTGDFDGDHKDDVLWRNDDGSTAIWKMDGTHTPSVSFPGGTGTDWFTQAQHYDYV